MHFKLEMIQNGYLNPEEPTSLITYLSVISFPQRSSSWLYALLLVQFLVNLVSYWSWKGKRFKIFIFCNHYQNVNIYTNIPISLFAYSVFISYFPWCFIYDKLIYKKASLIYRLFNVPHPLLNLSLIMIYNDLYEHAYEW